MIDFFYLGDYDPDVITKHSSTSPADENNATIDSSRGFQQEAVKYDTVTETRMEQRDDTEPGPDSHNADPAAEQPEDRTLSVKKKKKREEQNYRTTIGRCLFHNPALKNRSLCRQKGPHNACKNVQHCSKVQYQTFDVHCSPEIQVNSEQRMEYPRLDCSYTHCVQSDLGTRQRNARHPRSDHFGTRL
jgi:hypothetical protein